LEEGRGSFIIKIYASLYDEMNCGFASPGYRSLKKEEGGVFLSRRIIRHAGHFLKFDPK